MPTPDRSGPRRPRRDNDSARPGRPSGSGARGPRRDDSRPSRPRRDDDRPSRGRSFDSDRPSRPRRDDDRPVTRGRFGDRPERPSRPRRDDDRPTGRGRPSSGRPSGGGRFADRGERPRRPRRDDDRPSRGRSFDDRSARPQTDAQRRADQVRSRTGGRRNDRDAAPRNDHQVERWQDEGSTRAPRRGSRGRDNTAPIRLERDEKRASAPALAHVEATVGKKIAGIVGEQAAKRLIGKLALALDAFEKGRYQDAKRIIIPITRECEGVHLIHEIAGLSLYRFGQWRDAADHLEKARAAMPASTLNHPVLADCYRALMRYKEGSVKGSRASLT
mgnify:CR=1 FL=1